MNPFAQPAVLYRLSIEVPVGAVAFVEEACDDALAVSAFEAEDVPWGAYAPERWDDDLPMAARWRVEALFGARPDPARLISMVALLEEMDVGDIGVPEVAEVAREGWLAAVQASHPPLLAGRFWVAGSHIEDAPPVASIPLRIEAGLAFGSGEHATTRGCLLALGQLAKRRRFQRMLDMGCGSGILACAMAKLWPDARVLASDIDAVSARVTAGAARCNGIGRRVRALCGDGYRHPMVDRHGPYDLIVANILARPLTRMAPDLARHLAPGGIAVLSGLLTSQAAMVAHAHRQQGLRLARRSVYGDWCVLTFHRGIM